MESKDIGPVSKKPKKSKHHSLSVQSENITPGDQVPKEKKTKGPEHPERRLEDTTGEKKRKKRKKRDAEEQEEFMEHKPQSEEATSGPPKKKHKNRTYFADPREDTQLNTQSRKVLEYVFTQMNRPSKWKFNKARQNWLIKNIWSSETVPDIYFPLVLKYLANVRGGCREKLKESCQMHLAAEATSVDTPPSASSAKGDKDPAKPTPGPLITPSSQPISGSIVPAAAIIGVPAPVSDIANVVKRIRAQSLLDVLT